MRGRTGIAFWVLWGLCFAGASACTRDDDDNDHEVAPQVTTTVTTAQATAVPGVLLGVSTSPETRGVAAEKTAVDALEESIGRTLDINHNFYGWDEPFPTEVEQRDLQAGR